MTRLVSAAAFATVLAIAGSVAWIAAADRDDAASGIVKEKDQWPAYGGDPGGTRYSPLTTITRENVGRLAVAWTYRTGELGQNARSGDKLTFEATPVHFDGRLYLSTAFGRTIALDPATGREIWTFDPEIDRKAPYSEVTSRGVSTWRDPRGGDGECSRRIFLGTIDARLIALDAVTGKRCAGFGTNGEVDLAAAVGGRRYGNYQVTSPPAILRDLVIVGSSIGDNWLADTGSGVVRAFDARTGEQRWSWRPLPGSGPEAGAANAWSMISVDADRDLVFVPTTSPSPDFFGGLRPGDNRDANSVVALRGSTGDRVWAFQTVHHDLWDYDLAAQPALVEVTHDGRKRAAVAQATKMGFLFLLDRETGEPLFPVEERPVAKSDVPGEVSAPTQPFPVRPRPLMPIGPLTPETVWGPTEADRETCRAMLKPYRADGIYTPPSLQGTVSLPGNASGTNWGSMAYDPQRQVAVLNTSRLATLVQLLPRDEFDAAAKRSRDARDDYEYGRQEGAPFGMRRRTFLSPRGLPCIAPPWGTLAAVDLSTGDVRWEVPLGRGLADHPLAGIVPPDLEGVPNGGGPLVTASGLVFIAASMDSRFRAFDIETGRVLWETRLPRAGIATPMTYRTDDGRQMVVIAAGGHGKMGLDRGDYVIAFALK
ncbi:MAG TPA: pyrroloquinoline quinone-dependent dehydrogenase [Vicinamibacterales bacterium]